MPPMKAPHDSDDDVGYRSRATTADQLGSEPAGDESDQEPDDYDSNVMGLICAYPSQQRLDAT